MVVGDGVMNVHAIRDGGRRFTDDVPEGRHHGHASVHDLRLAEALHFAELHLLGESQGIEEAEGGDGSRESVAGLFRVGDPSVDGKDGRDDDLLSGGLHAKCGGGCSAGDGRGREGSGRASKGGDDGELHVSVLIMASECYLSFVTIVVFD